MLLKDQSFEDEIRKWDQKKGFYEELFKLVRKFSHNQQIEYMELYFHFLVDILKGFDRLGLIIEKYFNKDFEEVVIDLLSQTPTTEALESVMQISFLGNNDFLDNILRIDNESPFQHSSFTMPLIQEHCLIRNKFLFKIYEEFYLKSKYNLN
jgi:hypothetical protein